MAKPVIVVYGGKESSFDIAKLDRSKLYPTRKRVSLDAASNSCTRAAMTADGAHVLRSGMTAQGYFTAAGRWVAKNELVGIHPDGSLAPLHASTLGVAQPLEGPVAPRDVFDLNLVGVYTLDPQTVAEELLASLRKGEVYRFPFNYGADYNCETAYLLANDEGIFALVGKPSQPAWVDEATTYAADEADAVESDDLDFEMM
jgi:hypothetical protein